LPQLGRIRIDPGVSSSDSDASNALAQSEIALILSIYETMSIIKYGYMLACQDPSPCSAANPLPDDSTKSQQAFDIKQVSALEGRYSDAGTRFSLPSGKSISSTDGPPPSETALSGKGRGVD
jgi:hypothetical protein